MVQFILASGSPRRKELLEQVGMVFRIEAAHGEEIITKTEPSEIVRELSLEKATEVAKRVAGAGIAERTVVIGADTIVAFDGEIMGKPKDEADVKRMISLLQGHTHQVFTGVALIIMEQGTAKEQVIQFFEKTDVTMYPMSQEQIEQYIAGKVSATDMGAAISMEQRPWWGKAGAYGIQDAFGAKYIASINGEYNNVVGLPVARLLQELMKVGIEV